TVLSFVVLPWVIWLGGEGALPWRAAVVLGALSGVGVFLWLSPAAGYYFLRPFEASGIAYERLGVRLFRRLTVTGDYFNWAARKYDPQYRGVCSHGAVVQAERHGRSNERAHVAALVFLVPPTLCALLVGQYRLATALLTVNLLGNVYPVLLQRYTRARLNALMSRRTG